MVRGKILFAVQQERVAPFSARIEFWRRTPARVLANDNRRLRFNWNRLVGLRFAAAASNK